jgi:hypothetical protein
MMRKVIVFVVAQLIFMALPLMAQQDRGGQFDVADLTAEPQLALTLEFSSAGARVVSSTVLYGTPQKGTAHPDFTVIVGPPNIAPKTLRIPDPRIAHDGSTLSTGRIIVYVPFDPASTTLTIAPTEQREGMDMQRHALVMQRGPFGGKKKKAAITIDLQPLLQRACAAADAIAPCRALTRR